MKYHLIYLVKKFQSESPFRYPLIEDDIPNKTDKLPQLFEFCLVRLRICQNIEFPWIFRTDCPASQLTLPAFLLCSKLSGKHPKFESFFFTHATHLPWPHFFIFIPIAVLCRVPASTRNNFQSYCKPGAKENTKNDFKIFLLIQLFEMVSAGYSVGSQIKDLW